MSETVFHNAIKRPQAALSTSASFLCWRVNELQRMIENILCLRLFSLNVLKFYLYLLKQSIFRALRDLERAYLIITGQSFVIGLLIYAQLSFSGACESWILKNDCRHFMYSCFFPQVFSTMICIKQRRAFYKRPRETFERGACEACLQVVHSGTFRWARARSQLKFTKVRSKEVWQLSTPVCKSEIHQKPHTQIDVKFSRVEDCVCVFIRARKKTT